MKKIIFIILFFKIISTMNCVTLTVTQNPAGMKFSENNQTIPEKDKEQDSISTRNILSDENSEEEFFNDLSKQDPSFSQNLCKDCKPDNKPPGYINDETSSISQTTNSSTINDAVVIVNQNQPTDNANDSSANSENKNHELVGIASWYGREFNGRKTASGEIFNSRELTAAHRTLPLGTEILVTNLENEKVVVLRVNDRGPFVKDRILDVTEYAAELLEFKSKGLAKVEIKILKEGNKKEVGEGTTAFFYLSAKSSSLDNQGTSFYERTLNSKKDKILKEVIDEHNFKFFSVQIGAFRDISNVIKLKEDIESKMKYPVFIVKNSNDYTIRVGSFETRTEAESFKEKLAEEGYKGFVVNPS